MVTYLRGKTAVMPKRVVFSAIFFGFALAATYGQTKQPVQITQEADKLRIEINGEPFADYVFKGYAKPFLYPILGPGGAPMTRNWPMKEAPNEEHDHPHHKSFWWGHGNMNGVDFWSEGGNTVHEKFSEVHSGKIGLIKSTDKYVTKDGKVVCTDARTMRIYPGEKSVRMFDFEITVYASNGELKFGDTKEGTMALRLNETMRLKGKVGKGHIVNSEGVRDGDTWGKRAKWVDYYGPADDKEVGIAIFDHPSNPRHPTWWHVRDYGLFAANPFGLHDFEKKEPNAGELVVPAGKSITFKYRFYIHEGDEKSGAVEQAYERYIKEVK
jgi:hypothetical protein